MYVLLVAIASCMCDTLDCSLLGAMRATAAACVACIKLTA